MRQIDQKVGGLDTTYDTEEVQADLILMKSILLQVNVVFDKNNKNFASARDPIVDNKWFKYPQYPKPDITTCECPFELFSFLFNEELPLFCIRYGRKVFQSSNCTY